MNRTLEELLAEHQRDLAELLSLIDDGAHSHERMETLVERCGSHVAELMRLLDAPRPVAELPEDTRQSLAQLMRLHALTSDALSQEQDRLAQEIQQAQQVRQHLQANLPDTEEGGSCDMRG